MAIKKSDLYSSLWASCDELRGGMDASQYKDYVLFMLFIKYVSDKYGDSDDFAPPVTIPLGASFKDMVALKGKSDIGDKINTQVIQPLINANTRLARSDFPDFNDPNKLGEGQAMVDRLSNLIGIFQKPELDFSKNRAENDDILGDAYEYLMRHFASQSGKSKGQFYTPSEVSRIMADVYQHLMDYWAETMQDDCYLIADAGWQAGAQPREVVKIKDGNGKLVWPKEPFDYTKGKRRFKSDLIPAPILIARYFTVERDAIEALEAKLADVEQQLQEMMEENSGEEGLLAEVIEGEGDKQKITAKTVKARLKEIGKDPDYADERKALQDYAALLDKQTVIKAKLKAAQDDLEAKLDAKYPKLTEEEIKQLVVDDKWLATLADAVQGELDRVSQTLTSRIRQLAERYATPLPTLTKELATLSARVDEHLKKMGAVWN